MDQEYFDIGQSVEIKSLKGKVVSQKRSLSINFVILLFFLDNEHFREDNRALIPSRPIDCFCSLYCGMCMVSNKSAEFQATHDKH